MNLNQLKHFYVVCLSGSLSEASKYLYISQPSLSSSIKALEKEFGVSLFTRRYKGMELTTEGKRLLEMCKDILSRTEQLENIMKDLGNERTKLRLGVPPMIGSLILPYIYRDFCSLHPDITLEIVEDGRNNLLDKLSENYLDMIFLLH
ncbi:MAG: LysR family transcriptional regulator, partial [Clostridia bacterium]|nr:LysR family transcriptional regulator [Clostridia bacterium]